MTSEIRGIVETCVNVSNMIRARRFYESLFGFDVMEHDERFCAFRVGPDVLLLFTESASDKPIRVPGRAHSATPHPWRQPFRVCSRER